MTTEIPEIDIGILVQSLHSVVSLDQKLKVANEIVSACKNIGFFSIINHGIPRELIDEALEISREFFALPTQEKLKLAPKKWNSASSNVYRGYFPSSVNGKEGLDIGNPFFESNFPFRSKSSLHEVLPYPDGPFGKKFKRLTLDYYSSLLGLARLLLSAISLSLLKTEEHFEDAFALDRSCSTFRFNYYPHQLSNFIPPSSHGNIPLSCETHTDGSVLTILYQHEVGGLQVQNTKKEWIDVLINPNAFVVNIGLCLQHWTNDQLIATNHRVLFTRKERFSIPFFTEAKANALIDCTPFARAANQSPLHPVRTYEEFILESNKRFKEYQRQEN